MTREEALARLTPLILSFQREFKDADIYGKDGWMAICRNSIPDVIPRDYLKGVQMTKDGRVFTCMSVTDFMRKYENESIPPGRLACIRFTRYAGNPHIYGVLRISGVEMVYEDVENNKVITIGGSGPEQVGAVYAWEIELARILPEEEKNTYPGMWDMYDAGSRTQRFVDFKELVATAAYVALERIEDPFTLLRDESFYYQEKKRLMSVNDNGDVEFFNLMESWLNGD